MPNTNGLNPKHISLSTHNDVRSICQPLFSTTPINYFHYGRVYPDGHSMVLITHPLFHQFFWDNAYEKDLFDSYQAEGWFINKSCSCEILHIAKQHFDVDNWLLRIKHKKNYIESFGFATSSERSNVVNFYLNNQDKLEEFCLYFKEKAKKLIDDSHKDLLYTEGLDFSWFFNKQPNATTETIDLLRSLLIDQKYLIETPSENIIGITKIECLIIHYTSCGLSAKMIGKIMNVSPRTVEVHLLQIKEKLNTKNKSEIIKVYISIFKGNPPSVETIHHVFSKVPTLSCYRT